MEKDYNYINLTFLVIAVAIILGFYIQSDPTWSKDKFTLFSTLLGGGIAITSSILVTRLTLAHDKEKDRKQFLANKLETITDLVIEAGNNQINMEFDYLDGKELSYEFPLIKARIIAKLYYQNKPQLLESLGKLDDAMTQHITFLLDHPELRSSSKIAVETLQESLRIGQLFTSARSEILFMLQVLANELHN